MRPRKDWLVPAVALLLAIPVTVLLAQDATIGHRHPGPL